MQVQSLRTRQGHATMRRTRTAATPRPTSATPRDIHTYTYSSDILHPSPTPTYSLIGVDHTTNVKSPPGWPPAGGDKSIISPSIVPAVRCQGEKYQTEAPYTKGTGGSQAYQYLGSRTTESTRYLSVRP
eukprot:2807008-Pleurochrysis_carterae.AAC.1